MLLSKRSLRIRPRPLLVAGAIAALTVWSLWIDRRPAPPSFDAATLQHKYPLAWHHINAFNGTGGGSSTDPRHTCPSVLPHHVAPAVLTLAAAWYIPPEWLEFGSEPQSIVEAARLASEAASSRPDRQADFSRIPLIVHQTSRSAHLETWKIEVLPWVEQWLTLAVSPRNKRPMAYFFWDDDGILDLVREMEHDILDDFSTMFTPVERADVFRVLACKWFGGVVGCPHPLVTTLSPILPHVADATEPASTPTLILSPSATLPRGSRLLMSLAGPTMSLERATASCCRPAAKVATTQTCGP